MRSKFVGSLRFTFVFLLMIGPAAAQTKPTIVVSPNLRELEIDSPAGSYLPRSFVEADGAQVGNYELYEVEPQDRPGEVTADRSALLGRPEFKCGASGCNRLNIVLNSSLPPNQTFILRLKRYFPDGDAVTLRFATSAPAAAATTTVATIGKGANAYDQLDELTLISTNPVKLHSPLTVKRVFYRIKNGVPTKVEEQFTATTTWHTDQLYELHLDRKLVEGQTHVLVIDSGITDNAGTNVVADGKVELAAPPKKPEDRRLDMSLATVAAARQKAVFDLTAVIVPKRIYQVGDSNWLWEPKFNLDLGLRSTKSANSVVVAPLNFRNVFLEKVFEAKLPKGDPPELLVNTQAKDEAGHRVTGWETWRATPWYKPSDVEFTIGPKGEFDRNFKRKNVLGAVRFDLNFHRWLGTIARKRQLLEDSYGKAISSQVAMNSGWRLVPYVAFDFGGHVNNETVSKKGKSVFVPRHKIFRSYVGFLATIEWNTFGLPTSLNLEEYWVHLAARETIGFTTDSGVDLRQLRGFHPRSKATLDFAFDPSKHYTFSVGYENGRLAPNFEYLNKLSAGVKVVY